jgi:hypothetical protein
MPSHIRLFFGIVVALVLFWILSSIWGLVSLASQMAHRGDPIDNTTIFLRIFATTIQCLIYLIPAWLAAFHRKNWARWAFAVIVFSVPIFYLSPLLYDTGKFHAALVRAYLANLERPRVIAVDALLVAAVVLIFTGNARAWFKPSAMLAIQP